ncbi:MAG TPA: NCS2 family permease [Rhodothermales bacterium]
MHALDEFFGISRNASTFAAELRAGLATFLTMSYILFVNPQILAEAGMPVNDVAFATAISAAIATFIMGVWAHYPFALAPGMGLNAYFTYGVVLEMGVSWQTALAAVFVEGALFFALSIGGIRAAVLNAIPLTLKNATTAGIGLFLAIIGLRNAGIVVDDPVTLVRLGDLGDAGVLAALVGLALMAVLMVRRILGALLIGIVAVTAWLWIAGMAPTPESVMAVPSLPSETLLAFDFSGLLTGKLVAVVIAFLFVDFFDTAGTLVGVGTLGGFVDRRGEMERAGRAFSADAVGTMVGAVFGTSTVTTYVESATGVEEGGRTGLTAVVVAILFLLSLWFLPLFSAGPAAATAPALILVGALMMRASADIAWSQYDEGIPAFLTITAMPFTGSIANGIAAGIISYVLLKVFGGRPGDAGLVMLFLAIVLAVYYAIVGM